MTGSILLDGILVLFAGYVASILVCCSIVVTAWCMVKVRNTAEVPDELMQG